MRERYFKQVRYLWAIQFIAFIHCINPFVVFADPISGSFLTTFLISLAITASTTALQLTLAYVLAPKPKPIDKNKLSGDIKVTGIGEDVPIPEIYGGVFTDNLGGVQHGGIVVWASAIQKVVVQVPGGGGGKGAPRAAPQNEHHYYQSYAVLVGRGPLEVFQIDANTDVIYTNSPNTNNPYGVTYEAEGGATLPAGATVTLSGGATATSDVLCSNGQKVINVGGTGKILFNGVQVNSADYYHLYILYRNNGVDHDLVVKVNNTALPSIPLPDSHNNVRMVQLAVPLLPGVSNSIELSNPTATAAIDRIVVSGEVVIPELPPEQPVPPIPPPSPTEVPLPAPQFPNTSAIPPNELLVSGIKYPGYVNPTPTYDNVNLVDPLIADKRSLTEWNYQPSEDADGLVSVSTPLTSIRVYPGTGDQMPDPLLQSYFHSIYGPDSAPAYRHRCYVVIENLEITKYSALMPNFIFRTQHRDIRTLGAMFTERAKRAGLDDAELDFTALNSTPLRGVAIMQKQSPATDMAHLSRIYDTDVYETVDGVLTGVIPDETVVRQIPIEELQVKEGYKSTEADKEIPAPVKTIIRDEYQVPKQFSVGFFDVGNAFETGTVSAQREYTVSERHDSFDTQISLSKAEAQRFADRELQKMYAEKDAMSFETFYKHGDLTPTQLIEVEELDGSFSKMRVKAIEGWIPGVLTFQGVSRKLLVPSPRIDSIPTVPERRTRVIQRPPVPGYVIGTLIDVAAMRTSEYETGVYLACCLTNQLYKWQGATLIVEKDGVYEKLFDIHKQAIMGRTLNDETGVLPPIGAELKVDLPDGGSLVEPNESVELYLDLFCGSFASESDEAVIEDRKNAILIGNELCHFRTAEMVEGYPNRWKLTGVYRRAKGTSDAGHTAAERVVLLNNAVRWCPMDAFEYGTARNYKFVGGGQDADTVWSTSFTYEGNTTQTSGLSVITTSNHTVQLREGVIHVDASGGLRLVDLPDAAAAIDHEAFTIKKTDASANAVRVQCATGTVEGAAYYDLLFQNDSIDVYANVNGWWIK